MIFIFMLQLDLMTTLQFTEVTAKDISFSKERPYYSNSTVKDVLFRGVIIGTYGKGKAWVKSKETSRLRDKFTTVRPIHLCHNKIKSVLGDGYKLRFPSISYGNSLNRIIWTKEDFAGHITDAFVPQNKE